MKKMKNFAKLILFLLTFNAFAQSPWTQKKGKSYSQISFTSIANYDAIFSDSDQNLFGTYTDNTIQIFEEYGLSDKTSLLINVPIKLISVSNFEDPRIDCAEDCGKDYDNNTLGNISLGLKHNFYNKKWLVSGQLSVEANTSSFDAVSGIRTGYNAWSFTPLLLAGRGFNKTFIQAFIGADIRTNNYSSNFKIGGEIGRKLGNRIWLIAFVDVSKSLENGDVVLPVQQNLTGLYVNNQEYGSFGFKGIGEINDKIGVTAGYGNNVAKQAALTFGIYHKF